MPVIKLIMTFWGEILYINGTITFPDEAVEDSDAGSTAGEYQVSATPDVPDQKSSDQKEEKPPEESPAEQTEEEKPTGQAEEQTEGEKPADKPQPTTEE